ncbi:aldehyde dehydrogenase family protein [Halobellus sp. GM3]|uniref:aldehyde dehydrogenase family protein n=1 Tax=Halobellus sp. GM3 TaxID=3458410 RepID=UPI00403E05E6
MGLESSTGSDATIDREWGLFVDGEFRPASDGALLEVRNPATGDRLTEVAAGTAEDVDAAVETARDAFKEWKWTDPERRGDLLREVGDVIEAHEDELTRIESLENGKPMWQARRDVELAARRFRYFAGAADKLYGSAVSHTPEEVRTMVYEPYGVAGLIIPWNWPAMHTGDFMSVALAAGNSVVLKPSPSTPVTSLRMAELADEILPDGLINVIPGGVEPGSALSSHENVDIVAFTGSDANGVKVLESAAQNITPVMAELGGKNPTIVFPDADLETAAQTAVSNSFFNSGQACTNPERLLIHEDVYDEFLERVSAQVADFVLGSGLDDETQIGPQATPQQAQKFAEYLDIAVDEGATIHTQASLPDDPELEGGNFVRPTVLTDVDPEMRIAQEEVFGPLVGVMSFADEAEAIEIANGVKYGLSAAIYTQDLERAHRVASRIEAGIIGVNHPSFALQGLPFGGYKRSGIGRKNDFEEAMHDFVQSKSIEIDLTEGGMSL